MSESANERRLDPLVVRFQWHCRRAGGLFLGLRIGFPVSILFDNGEVRPTTQISVGFLVATLSIELRGRVTHTHNNTKLTGGENRQKGSNE